MSGKPDRSLPSRDTKCVTATQNVSHEKSTLSATVTHVTHVTHFPDLRTHTRVIGPDLENPSHVSQPPIPPAFVVSWQHRETGAMEKHETDTIEQAEQWAKDNLTIARPLFGRFYIWESAPTGGEQ